MDEPPLFGKGRYLPMLSFLSAVSKHVDIHPQITEVWDNEDSKMACEG